MVKKENKIRRVVTHHSESAQIVYTEVCSAHFEGAESAFSVVARTADELVTILTFMQQNYPFVKKLLGVGK